MSSASGGDGGGGGGVHSGEPRQYFCHQCNGTVSISLSPSSDLLCPNCNGGFLEELEIPTPNPVPNPTNPFFSFTSDFPVAGTATIPLVFSGGNQPFDDLSTLFGNRSDTATGEPFNPFVFLQNYFQTLRAGGANVQFVIESGEPGGTFRFPGNVTHGDYFFGPGLEELIQHLAENDPNRYGTPPASKTAVEGLPDISVTEELLATDSAQCAVCKDTFGLGEIAKQMPCKHIYHADCILPWLELHNSCPVCRYELPTDDPDYEQRAHHGGGGLGGGVGPQVNWNLSVGAGGSTDSSGSAGGGDNSQRRRFRVSLPWPFRQSVAETSNVGNDNNNNNSNSNSGNNGGQSNSENRGNRNFESETRQEDLD
ncbi:hypothetical protein VNO77_33280 [Canavalia gladiata]|uniref:RING-type E3 ubiquitin transferase n=1 Tax=Canavalia gladiata TaxID=3824 RepID=A0AAN9KEM2_CANGL